MGVEDKVWRRSARRQSARAHRPVALAKIEALDVRVDESRNGEPARAVPRTDWRESL
jgi:hypothetical protein